MARADSLGGRAVSRWWMTACGSAALLLVVCGCAATTHREQINSARTTITTEAAGTRQVLAGLKDDLTHSGQAIPQIVNINYASQKELATLPGINMRQAHIIIDNRPYDTPLDLFYKHVVTKAEYQRIKGRVDAWDNLGAAQN